jgi:hypothetical protein
VGKEPYAARRQLPASTPLWRSSPPRQCLRTCAGLATAPFETSLQPTLPGIRAMMTFLQSGVPNVRSFQPEQFVDTRFLGQLPSPGA